MCLKIIIMQTNNTVVFIRPVSVSEAVTKFGIVHHARHNYKYYLLDNGNIIDNDGDIRYIKQIC